MNAMPTARMVAALAERGWPVFPCEPGGKRPRIDRWEQRASDDPEIVYKAWLERWAGSNIGVACRRTLVVVDLDCHGELPADWRAIPGVVDGRDVFALLLERAGQSWPETAWSVTPSGGWHLWFAAPADPELRNTASMLGPGVDTRASGGYVLGPGSVIDGREYEWIDDRELAALPAWLCRRLAPRPAVAAARPSGLGDAPARLHGLVDHVRAGAPGDRNGRLYWAACRLGELIASGRAAAADSDLLVGAALEAGLRGGEAEARRTIASGLRSGAGS